MSILLNIDATYEIFQRSQRSFRIHILDPAGNPIDVQAGNYQWIFEVKRRPGVTPTLISVSNAAGVLENDGEYVVVTLSAELLDILGGTYWFDLERTDDDEEDVYVRGNFVVLDQ